MRIIHKGATSQTLYLVILDSASTTGGRKTGIAFNTASLVANYVRNGAARTAITLATQTASGAWSSGGFAEVDATNAPGLYRFDVPDAAFASGVDSVVVTLKGASGMVGVEEEVQLTGLDPQDTVRAALTALPNAAAGANGGLPLGDANARVDVSKWLGTAVTAATAGVPDTNAARINNVAATSVTTINANQGTTQPVNFTGTAGTALVKGDAVDVAGAAVSTASAQIGVNVINVNGTAQTARDLGAQLDAAVSTRLPASSIQVRSATAQAGAASTITLDSSASATDNLYRGLIVLLISGTGAGQARLVSGYVGSTKVATVNLAWTTNPDNTTVFGLLAFDWMGLVDGVWDEATSGHGTAGTTGAALTAAGAGTNPWDVATSGHTTAGTFGALVVTNLDAAISGVAAAVWAVGARTLTSFGTLAADVWSSATRTLSAFGFNVTVGTNNDKTGYSLSTTPPTAAAISTQVWSEVIPGSFTAGQAGGKLNTAASASGGGGGSGGTVGSGAISYPVTVTQPNGTTPIEGVAVWVSTDSGGTNVVAGTLYSDTLGRINTTTGFMLDAGSYYLWRQHSKWTFTNPTSFTVS